VSRNGRCEDGGLLRLQAEVLLTRNDSLKPHNNESYVLLQFRENYFFFLA
jgi:hypothetical protein